MIDMMVWTVCCAALLCLAICAAMRRERKRMKDEEEKKVCQMIELPRHEAVPRAYLPGGNKRYRQIVKAMMMLYWSKRRKEGK